MAIRTSDIGAAIPLTQDPSGHEASWRLLAEATDAAEYCRAWLALQCAEIGRVGTALLLLEGNDSAFVPAAVWPDAQADVSYLGPIAQRCLSTRSPQSERAEGAHSGRMFVASPLEDDGRMQGCVVLDLPLVAASELHVLWRRLHWGSGRLETMLLRRALQQRAESEDRTRTAMNVLATASEHETLDETLMQLANRVASSLGCERVAIGIEKRGRIRLAALSDCAWFEARSAYVLALENAMEEACDQARSVCHPPAPDLAGAPVSVAHRDLAGQGGALTVPLAVRGRMFGAITCTTRGQDPAAMTGALEAIAALVAPSLSLRVELRRWVTGRLATSIGHLLRGCLDPRRPVFRVALVSTIAVLLFLGFADGTYRVRGRAVIEGEIQRSLAAPFEGFIAGANVRAGESVTAGQVLARLDDRDLRLDLSKWRAEREQADRKYRDALARHDRPNARILAAQLAEADAQVALVEDKLQRANVSAPFDGMVVSGDLSQMLGTPVEKGKVLFEIAPLDAYRVILKVPETEIHQVKLQQHGHIVLAGISGRRLPFRVKNIGVAAAEDGENVFRVEAELTEGVGGLRPGMEGVGKIVIGERRLVWIWTHSLLEWLHLKMWRLLP